MKRAAAGICIAVIVSVIVWVIPQPDRYYVASSQSYAFHKPGCSAAENIQEGNLVRYETIEAAKEAGKRSCQICVPDREDNSAVAALGSSAMCLTFGVLFFLILFFTAPKGHKLESIKTSLSDTRNMGCLPWLMSMSFMGAVLSFSVATLIRLLQLLFDSW